MDEVGEDEEQSCSARPEREANEWKEDEEGWSSNPNGERGYSSSNERGYEGVGEKMLSMMRRMCR